MMRLSNRDLELIMAKVARNVHANYNEERTQRSIVERWEKAKSTRLFDLFGGELIIKKPIQIEKSVHELSRVLNDEDFDILIEIKFKARDLSDEDYAFVRSLTFGSALAENRVQEAHVIEGLTEKPLKFSKGQKITKALAQLVQAFKLDMEKFEEFRIRHSQILNDKMLAGNLCLSIHPLDYMTMSDNAHDWDSCMSWDDSGCYVAGTLECMNCENTIVAYLESEDREYVISRYGEEKLTWNSKKWRQLVMITPELIMTNKGYPFRNDQLSQEVLNWVAELAGEDFEGENIAYEDYSSNSVPGFDYVYVNTDFMYDDTDNGSYSFVRLGKLKSSRPSISLGGVPYCLCCGEIQDNEESLICYSCEDKGKCYECGDVHDTDYLIEVKGELYCSYCHDQTFRICEECGETQYYDLGSFLDEDDLEKYEGEKWVGWYCNHCINDMPVKTDDLLNIQPVE